MTSERIDILKTSEDKDEIFSFFNFYTFFSDLFHQMKRYQSSIKLNANIKRYLTHKRYKGISSEVKECYSIYPSNCDSNSIDIMIYSEPSNVRKGRCVPLKFCSLRRSFVFDVYKNKYRFNKILRFNFIINHNEIVDSAYASKKIDGKVVNEINFGT